VLCNITSRTFNPKKETYIYCQIGTKLLTSLSGDPLNLYRRNETICGSVATYSHYLDNLNETNLVKYPLNYKDS
jgi:hypothetical protein